MLQREREREKKRGRGGREIERGDQRVRPIFALYSNEN